MFVGSNVLTFLRKLDDLNVGVLTYGLAFHLEQTTLLRFPFNNEEFFEQVFDFYYNIF
jgi:hypothetical protein